MGDIRQALSRRRVLGSNFARAELSREEATFNQERDQITAESFLQELAASVDLIGKEFDAKASSFQTLLNEQDFEANIALALATGSQQVYGSLKSQAMALESGAAQQSAAGINGVFGNILGQASSYGFSQLPQAGGGGGAAAGGAT